MSCFFFNIICRICHICHIDKTILHFFCKREKPSIQERLKWKIFTAVLDFFGGTFLQGGPILKWKICTAVWWWVHFIQPSQLLTCFKSSSFQDELQEFFSEFGPVHQLNILRDKSSGISRQEIQSSFCLLQKYFFDILFQGMLLCHLLQPARCFGSPEPTSQCQNPTWGE